MATLTIRNVPDDLYAALKERARRNRRSLNQEVLALLEGEFARTGRGEGVANRLALLRQRLGDRDWPQAQEVEVWRREGRL
jgi:plasmid stability protein